MKIDKRRPSHWLTLCLFGIQIIVARCLRPLVRSRRQPDVVLYGHKLCGNLLALHRYVQAQDDPPFVFTFLTMDRAYCKVLRAQGVRCMLATSPRCALLLARASAVISDHGLHVLRYMIGCRGLRFFDVWHGIPFKGFDADDFRLQHRYDEVWVASPLMKRLYVERYGFDERKVKITGYARTDRLVRQDEDIAAIKRDLGLDGPDVGKIVLFAPTWKQDVCQRSIYPFGTDEHAFLEALSGLAKRTRSTIVMRTHLNSGVEVADAWERIVQRPFADFPDTEALLLASDVLVCDWSSIAFDWLLLKRPTIFLDVEPPFAKGLSLGKDYRYGEVVTGLEALTRAIARTLTYAQGYWQCYADQQQAVRQRVYGGLADNGATARCAAQLRENLTSSSAGKCH